MEIVLWDRPIRAGGKLIFGPQAAMEFMNANWPAEKDGNFTAATRAILAALGGHGSPDLACARFEKALASAKL